MTNRVKLTPSMMRTIEKLISPTVVLVVALLTCPCSPYNHIDTPFYKVRHQIKSSMT